MNIMHAFSVASFFYFTITNHLVGNHKDIDYINKCSRENNNQHIKQRKKERRRRKKQLKTKKSTFIKKKVINSS